jgi:hypothetical protein
MYRILNLAGACGVGPCGAASAATANLLPNASFAEVAGDSVAGFAPRAWAGGDAARWATASPGRTGAHCASIASESGTDAAWTATLPVRPQTWYRLSGWIRTERVRGAAGALLNIQGTRPAPAR